MDRVLFAVLAWLWASPAFGAGGMLLMAAGSTAPGDPTGWVLQADGLKATVDFDFVNNIALSGGTVAAPATKLTVTRASTGYADDTSGNWTSFATNTPRITNKGLLVEEARTNSISNNSMQGAVAGTPGTLPTGWSHISPPTTTQIVGVGTQNGIDYVDVRFAGPGASTNYLQFDTATAATNSQAWTGSFFMALVGGSLTNIGNVTILIQTNMGGSNSPPLSLTSTLTRFSLQFTTQASGVTNNALYAQFFASGGAFDLTIRIGWPQLELGAWATSPIRTTSAAATRAADTVTATGFTSGAAATYYLQGPGTLATGFPGWGTYQDSAGQNVLTLYTAGGGQPFSGGTVNAGAQQTINFGTAATPARHKGAIAVAAGNMAYGIDGFSAALTGTWSGNPMDRFLFGAGSIAQWGTFIERMTAWQNNRISNAGLVSLTQ